ncbi:hypothetical protein [Flagellimonas amoyensis]|uniref:hypothetical protein n=1 Tax=Flagellimonas amoyensis TaxID=2169401 RepID=UPI000D34A9C6|nr:hypothetical protein [Allomuricauda amoyensis]
MKNLQKGVLGLVLVLGVGLFAQSKKVPVPVLDGEWWQIASTPDLGKFNTDKQQPVDFGIWKAADGTWQLWSCIRNSNFEPGTRLAPAYVTTRFLYGWEGKSLFAKDWEPQGIKWTAEPTLGETPGGMQAPYMFKEDGVFYLFYGDLRRICLAKSYDGKNFERVLGGNGQPDLFAEYGHWEGTFFTQARDPMVIKRGNTYYCYYSSHVEAPYDDGAGFVRTSVNMVDWSESVMVSHTPIYNGSDPKYSDECPQVVYLPEHKLYYLFVTQKYGEDNHTTVYASPNPYNFGVDDDSQKVCTLPIAAPEIIHEDGQYYIAALNPGLDGVRVIKLKWE